MRYRPFVIQSPKVFLEITWCTRALKHSSADDWNCRLHPCSLCGRESVVVISASKCNTRCL